MVWASSTHSPGRSSAIIVTNPGSVCAASADNDATSAVTACNDFRRHNDFFPRRGEGNGEVDGVVLVEEESDESAAATDVPGYRNKSNTDDWVW